MFTTIEQTSALTGYDVTLDVIIQSQGIIESYIGRVEEDIESPDDLAILGRATAYQAAYMRDNYSRVFEQMAVYKIAQSDGGVSLSKDMAAPFLAPLAIYAMNALSWKRSRSVRTGAMYGLPVVDGWETA